jgi:hypothetical protein
MEALEKQHKLHGEHSPQNYGPDDHSLCGEKTEFVLKSIMLFY